LRVQVFEFLEYELTLKRSEGANHMRKSANRQYRLESGVAHDRLSPELRKRPFQDDVQTPCTRSDYLAANPDASGVFSGTFPLRLLPVEWDHIQRRTAAVVVNSISAFVVGIPTMWDTMLFAMA
jgi:hypothetical protein